MITAFTVKNFKAIGDDPVRIELRPITLLFGANSAGKSSILHALNYAYSVFIDRNPNAEYNAHSSSIFNLGGFSRFVHNNDLNRSILLRFELDLKAENDIPDYCFNDLNYFEHSIVPHPYEIMPMLNPRAILAKVKNAYIEVEISWNYEQGRPYVSKYSTGVNGTWIASICSEGYNKKNYISGFNVIHPVFNNLWTIHGILMGWLILNCIKSDKLNDVKLFNNKCLNDKYDKLIDRHQALKKLGRVPTDISTEKIALDLYYQNDALPEFLFLSSRKLNLFFGEIWRDPDYLDPTHHDYDYDFFEVGCPRYEVRKTLLDKKIVKKTNQASVAAVTVAIEDFFNSVLLAPGLKVANWLNSYIRYLGPLREILSRHFLGEISKGNSESIRWRWEKGLGAWDRLYRIGQSQLDLSQKPHEDIHSWLKENFKKYHMKIWDSVLSDPKYKADFDKYLDDLPDAALFIKAPSQKSTEDIFTWLIENFEKYLNGLPADVLVSLNLPRKSSSLREDADRLLYRINDWLASDQRLKTGYKVIIERFREISSVIFKDFDEEKSQENVFVLLKKILNEPEIIRIWLHDISRSINLKPHEIGTGISQVLPVVVAAVDTDAPMVIIEQPELHIHPAMQVQLGDLFITQSSDKKFFLIETHSEHLLLRILRRVRETTEEQASDEVKILPNQVAIYYVESENGSTQVNHIGLDENGRFTDRWPKGFFAERMQEMLPSDIRERVEAKRRGKI